MKRRSYRPGIGSRVFDTLNVVFMIGVAVAAIYPFLRILALSLSAPYALDAFPLSVVPRHVNLRSYIAVFAYEPIRTGFKNSIWITAVGTFCDVFLTMMGAYALSKERLPHRGFFTVMFVFTMFFNPGLIPNYLNIKSLGLVDRYGALLLPRLINTYYLIVCRNFFMSISPEIEESAKLDGANDITILFRLILPLSVPIFVTLLLWYGVRRWNTYFDGMIYISSPSKFLLSVVLRNLISQGLSTEMRTDRAAMNNLELIRNNAIVVTTIPIVMVYPFVQRYFIKGIMIGSLKE